MILTLEGIDTVANLIAQHIAHKQVVCFYGSMGAGKTTLIKAVCRALGVADVVASPTFALVNEYSRADGSPIYHFDFYRINTIEEVYDFGYEEYFYNPDGLCLIEWPEIIEAILPENAVRISISVNADLTREVRIVG